MSALFIFSGALATLAALGLVIAQASTKQARLASRIADLTVQLSESVVHSRVLDAGGKLAGPVARGFTGVGELLSRIIAAIPTAAD